MNTELTAAADILERAADGFESGRYGWVKGVSYAKHPDGTELYCATGALYHEAGLQRTSLINTPEYQEWCEIYSQADKALYEAIEFNGRGGVPGWNDYFASSMAEVIEKMKEAAKNLRNKEEAR